MRIAIIAALCFAAGIGGTFWWMSGAHTHEECMLREMAGQDKMMFFTVEKLCDKRFKKEVIVPDSAVHYGWSGEGPIAQVTIGDSGEYNVTRLKAVFSGKPCNESKAEDFSLKGESPVKSGVGTMFLDTSGVQCMRVVQFYGTYK